MSVWMLITLLGLLKMLIAGLMLWVPYRNDRRLATATSAAADVGDAGEQGASEDEGGSTALPASPSNPRPRSPRPRPRRRGPHGSDPAPPSPPRVRTAVRAGIVRMPSTSRADAHR